MTVVRFALVSEHAGLKALAVDCPDPLDRPALLVSYVYLHLFRKRQAGYRYRDWVMDSGAFSAHNAGKTIDLAAYMDTCRELLATDRTLTEVFALDVIGDWRASARNTGIMWGAGIPCIPTFHPGEPWDVLVGLAAEYPKIALGGVVGWSAKKKLEWVGQCFARIWRRDRPVRVHGLGMVGKEMLNRFPFHSVDASSWELAPRAFGEWAAYGNKRMGIRGAQVSLRVEIDHYMEMERMARHRWAREMARLEQLPTTRRGGS